MDVVSAGQDRQERASTTPVSMIDRITHILDAFEEAESLTLSEVVRHTGLPRSSTHRILEHLTAARFLRREANAYHLGMRIMELGSLMYHRDRVRAASMPHLQQLHWSTGLTSQLAVLDEGRVVYLLQVGEPAALPSRHLVGGRFHATRTVVGKALLAHTTCPPGTAHPPLPPGLRAELADIRARGVALDRDSGHGIGCVAAPVVTPGDRSAVAAISVTGPTASMQFPHLAAILRQTAQTLRNGTPTL
ncbi:IclR family transcriptional regulator [Streptomyces albidoflavus]